VGVETVVNSRDEILCVEPERISCLLEGTRGLIDIGEQILDAEREVMEETGILPRFHSI
jgi:8-oxo-dGTP pyrophosphatase MutT (NUDIX family)